MNIKITAMLDKNLVSEAITLLNAKNTTEALKLALQETISRRKIMELDNLSKNQPIQFIDGFTAEKIRNLNR